MNWRFFLDHGMHTGTANRPVAGVTYSILVTQTQHNSQRRGRTWEWVGGETSKDMKKTWTCGGGEGEDVKASGNKSRAFIYTPFSLYSALKLCLTCVCMHTYLHAIAKMAMWSLMNITGKTSHISKLGHLMMLRYHIHSVYCVISLTAKP